MTPVDTRTRSWLARALPRVLVAAGVVLVLGIVFGEAAKHGAVPFDRAVTRDLSDLGRSHSTLRVAMEMVTFFGSTAWLTGVVLVATIASIARRAVARAVRLVLCTGVGAALATVLKVIVDRPRPPTSYALVHATGLSFPSGHAMNSTVVYGALMLLFVAPTAGRSRVAVATATAVAVALIALSRLVLGVHYLSDVVGGLVLGTTWLALIRPVMEPNAPESAD